MGYLWELLRNVVRIVFLRGSPERLHYTRRLFIVSLLLAITASTLAQRLYHGDHLVFVILRVFAELTLFMLMAVLLTRSIARFRLARMLLAMVLISLLADSVLILLSPLPLHEHADSVAVGVAVFAGYGVVSAMQWGLQQPLVRAAGYVGLYVVAVLLLDAAFRHLYGMVAGG